MEAAAIEPTMTTIDDLNHDCLREILSYINVRERMKCREVSKSFCAAADACWGGVRLVAICFYPDRRYLEEQNLHGSGPRVIIETIASTLPEEVLKRCGDSIKTLYEFRMGDDPTLSSLPLSLQYCPQLEHLRYGIYTAEDVNNMRQLLLNITCLKSVELDIRQVFQNIGQIFSNIAPENLKKLVVSNLVSQPIQKQFQRRILSQCSSLKFFSTDECDDEIMELIVQKNSALEVLKIGRIDPTSLTNRGFSHVFKLKHLKLLTLSKTTELLHCTDDFLMALVENLPLLEELHIENPRDVTNAGFKSLASLKKLEFLKLYNCEGITDEFLELFTGLGRLFLTNCSHVHDEGVIRLLERTETMRILDLCGTSITRRTLEAAAKAVHKRTNGVGLRLDWDGTNISSMEFLPCALLENQ